VGRIFSEYGIFFNILIIEIGYIIDSGSLFTFDMESILPRPHSLPAEKLA
jgi:hypothetical protein